MQHVVLGRRVPRQDVRHVICIPVGPICIPWSGLDPTCTNDFEEAKAFLLALDLEGMTGKMAETYAGWLMNAVTLTYQGFYASFGVPGDPNTLLESAPLKWSPVDGGGDAHSGVIRVQVGGSPEEAFHHVVNEHNTRSICSFWQDIARLIAENAGQQTRGEL